MEGFTMLGVALGFGAFLLAGHGWSRWETASRVSESVRSEKQEKYWRGEREAARAQMLLGLGVLGVLIYAYAHNGI
jgi:hypothetical protein